MVKKLRRAYASRYGVPVISAVETDIFLAAYFAHCMHCTFCHDWCCSFGVDIDAENVKRIQEHAEELEHYTGIPRDRWFTGEFERDAEFPGGTYTRTATVGNACIFLDTKRRGCLLHRFSIEKGIDYHELKPMVSSLFPLTFEGGKLVPAEEVDDKSLVCAGEGPSLYRGVREEIRYYFGEEMVGELDEIERTVGAYQEK